MYTSAAFRAGAATHPGHQRGVNEDRVLADVSKGIFAVVDGMGGHAAGDLAAETAIEAIREELLATPQADIKASIRQAITEANNRILAAAQSNSEWDGMACVVTVAVVHQDRLIWGHVGDSRLYLFSNGTLQKLTPDHSPVGEQEDGGKLDEYAAMRHPRRNEVFRNVGSQWRQPDDPDFIETAEIPLRPDSAFLLCSDGLSDALSSDEIATIVGQCEGGPELVAARLVAAANDQSGSDNVSVVFAAGPEYGSRSLRPPETAPRHGITRVRAGGNQWRFRKRSGLWLIIGMLLGILLAGSWEHRADLVRDISRLGAGHWASQGRK